MKIGRYIGELLYQHDCVIINDFGGFVANYRSATIHPVQHTFSPPSKSIAFNQNLTKNDGLLANFICDRLLLSYPDACRLINDFVIICNTELERGNKVIIENIGELFYDYEKNLQFVPVENKNYLLDSFGFSDIQSPAIKREKDFDIYSNDESKVKVIPAEKRKNYLKPALRIAAITGIAAMLTWAYFNPVISGKISKSIASIFPEIGQPTTNNSLPFDTKISETKTFKEAVAKTETQPVEDIYQKPVEEKPVQPSENTSLDKDKIAELPAENIEPAKVVAPEIKKAIAPKTSIDLTSNTNDKYFIIGGCFSVAENAAKLNDELKLKGFPSQLLGKGKRGLEMVSISSAANREKAEEMLGFVQTSGYPDAWIMRK